VDGSCLNINVTDHNKMSMANHSNLSLGSISMFDTNYGVQGMIAVLEEKCIIILTAVSGQLAQE
jgi:hypothetical protein